MIKLTRVLNEKRKRDNKRNRYLLKIGRTKGIHITEKEVFLLYRMAFRAHQFIKHRHRRYAERKAKAKI